MRRSLKEAAARHAPPAPNTPAKKADLSVARKSTLDSKLNTAKTRLATLKKLAALTPEQLVERLDKLDKTFKVNRKDPSGLFGHMLMYLN